MPIFLVTFSVPYQFSSHTVKLALSPVRCKILLGVDGFALCFELGFWWAAWIYTFPKNAKMLLQLNLFLLTSFAYLLMGLQKHIQVNWTIVFPSRSYDVHFIKKTSFAYLLIGLQKHIQVNWTIVFPGRSYDVHFIKKGVPRGSKMQCSDESIGYKISTTT
ncbi:hypothetical protein Ccrd_009246 [Cynara cardunculus var. scolymus]|uniref:Uncharacterized protein n=1 Tax=Cynara cardunculus var. scolymus TaxID=59895 RepID=A0A103YNE9_CYNCS|nr:hypothetical protein Ccrd_009246 [Cynara cardunculus var. scolymus]